MRWITAHNLQEWSNTLGARTTFPALIADLVTASSPKITDFRFPSREKGQVRGFDGVLEATGAPPFVPDGRSIWEFGVSSNVLEKANGDFEKRTQEVDDATKAETTFVFATPKTWDHPAKQIPQWLAEKRALNRWKGVECLDATALEHWLDLHPAVASNYARHEMGVAPTSGAYSCSEFWNEFSARFAPTLMEDVLLAGREAQAAELLRQLAEGGSRIAYAADSADEVIAFVVAAMRRAPLETRSFLESRAMVVDSEDAARHLALKKGLIFLPRGQARRFVGILAQAGPTVISAGADEHGQHDRLARPNSSQLAKAFAAMGMTESEGYDLARRSGRSLAVLARQKPSGTAESPEWLGASEALLPALLAGAWTPSGTADAEVVRVLGGRATYEEVEAPLRALTRLKDPPIDRIEDVWAMRSSVDAFVHLGHLIGGEHLSRFTEQVKAVFSRIVEAPRAEDVFQVSRSQRGQHSNWLREGMMTTLLHMAALHREAGFVVTGSTPQRFVDDIVRDLPNLLEDYRLLESLREHLPLLAEAAPVPFLDALERLLEGDAEKIRPIFAESEEFFAPTSAHTGVLWALELLAWSEIHLLRAATCLARLAAIDPGGKLANRPINSLRDVLLAWAPHTNAPSRRRIGVLQYVVRMVPSIAWPLLAKLLPRHHDHVSMTQKPRFAEAAPGGEETLTYGIVWATQAAVAELAVQHAQLLPERWEALIAALSRMQPDAFDSVAVALADCLDKQERADRVKTWDALRKEVNRHRAFRGAEWVLSEESLQRLESVVTRFQPEDPLLSTTWLFDDWMPDVQGKRDVGDPMKAIEKSRLKAINELFATRGVDGIVALAASVKLPFQMSTSLLQLPFSMEQLVSLISQVLELKGEAKSLSAILVSKGFEAFGNDWIDQVSQLQAKLNLSAEDTARLFFAIGDVKGTWDLVAIFGRDVDAAYWRLKSPFGLNGSREEIEYAISRYVACKRALAAIEATHRHLVDVKSATLLDLLKAAVPEINAMNGSLGNMVEYYVEHLFDELEKRSDVVRDDLAHMEFAYLPFFHRRERPLTLHKMLVESPEFFVSTIASVFRPASGEAPSISEHERRLANAAYELLNSLDILPGQVGEKIDPTLLQTWSDEVRARAAQLDRRDITDSRIGYMLAHAPVDDEDGVWPHRAVRQVIEQLSSEIVEQAVRTERFNMRGVYSKGVGEGGAQERALAEEAMGWANAVHGSPRTAGLLSAIAEMWVAEGQAADVQAAQDALRS